MSAQQREIPAPLSVFAFSKLVGNGTVFVKTSPERYQVERDRDFALSDAVCYGVSPIVVLVREDAIDEAAKAATRAERDRIAWLAEGMANKLHTFDADMVAGCLADLVAYLRSDK